MKANRLDLASLSALVSSAVVYLSGEPLGPTWSKVATGALALLGFYLARVTPHAAKPAVTP